MACATPALWDAVGELDSEALGLEEPELATDEEPVSMALAPLEEVEVATAAEEEAGDKVLDSAALLGVEIAAPVAPAVASVGAAAMVAWPASPVMVMG